MQNISLFNLFEIESLVIIAVKWLTYVSLYKRKRNVFFTAGDLSRFVQG